MTGTLRQRLFRGALIGALALSALLAGCQDKAPPFQNLDITGSSQFGTGFSLHDSSGKLRQLAEFKGKIVVLVFGYTHCPDVCPTTLAELAQSIQQLGPLGSRVQVLFITVDPARDTDTVLGQYVKAFNPSFVALRPANDAELKQVTSDFRIYYAKVAGNTPDDYSMDHTAASYVFDTQGKLRLFARDGQGVTPWVHDFKLLLD